MTLPKFFAGVALLALIGCGTPPPPLGVMVNELPVNRELFIDPALPATDFLFDMEATARELVFVAKGVSKRYSLEGKPLGELRSDDNLSPVMAADVCGDRTIKILGVANGRLKVGGLDGTWTTAPIPVEGGVKLRLGDVVGDESPEILVQRAPGQGLDIRDCAGNMLAEMKSQGYLVDFVAVPSTSTAKDLIVLHSLEQCGETERCGSFRVTSLSGEVSASWIEPLATRAISVGQWTGEHPFVFYLTDDAIVLRSLTGEQIASIPVTAGGTFSHSVASKIYGEALARDYAVVVASGGGYNPYHTVCVLEKQKLVFQQINEERASGVAVTDPEKMSFIVASQKKVWKYSLSTKNQEEP